MEEAPAFPDLPTAASAAARWELEFALDPGPHAAGYSSALNSLAIAQENCEMPEAAIESWIKARQVATHPDIEDRKQAYELESCVLFNVVPALLRADDAERALAFAERMVELEAGEFGDSSARGIAADYRADCLRALGRTDQELEARVDALGHFALSEDTPEVPGFTTMVTTHTANRIAQILDGEA